MSTQFSYNGISIPYPKTQDISDQIVMDGGDYLYTEWTFRIAGVVFQDAYSNGESAPEALARIEHYLEQPRKRLTYIVNGTTILDVDASPNTTGTGDCANGPIPTVLSVVRVDGGQAIWVEFAVVAHVRKCPGGPAQQYLSNRWRESIRIDETSRTTRTRVGRIVLRSDFNAAADSFRGLVTPPIPSGFIRESSHYDLTEDGLRIQYEFVDKEAYFLPPVGTFKAKATYKESCTNGATRFAEVSCQVIGDVRSNRAQLIATAISIAVQRMDRSGIARSAPGGRWLATGAFSEDLYEPIVEVQIRAMLKPGPAAGDGKGNLNVAQPQGRNVFQKIADPFNVLGDLPAPPGNRIQANFAAKPVEAVNVPGKPSILAGWGEVPFGTNNTVSPDPGIRGTAGLTLLAAALNDPCLNQAIQGLLSSPGNLPGAVLLPANGDPGASTGGGAGSTQNSPDPFFNPQGFIAGGGA